MTCSVYAYDVRPRRFVSSEHFSQVLVRMEARHYSSQSCTDYESIAVLAGIQRSHTSHVPDSLFDYLAMQRVCEDAYHPVWRLKWLVWRDIRLMAGTAKAATSRHNTRVSRCRRGDIVAWREFGWSDAHSDTKVLFSESNRTTAASWARWCDGQIEEALARRGMLVKSTGDRGEYANTYGER